jgi:hypothetical protein
MIVAKWSDTHLSPHLFYFKDFFNQKKINPNIQSIQLIAKEIETKKNSTGIEMMSAIPWLENLSFHSLI